MMKSKEKKNPIEEARRYVANAAENIAKAEYDPETKSYLDSFSAISTINYQLLTNNCQLSTVSFQF